MNEIPLPPSMQLPVPRPFKGVLDVIEGKLLWLARTSLLFFVSFLMLWFVHNHPAILPGPLGFFGITGSLIMGVLSAYTIWDLILLMRLWRTGVVTTGTFRGVERREVKGHELWNAGVEYRDAAGRVWEGRLIVPAQSIHPSEGETIRVVFLSEKPIVCAAFTGTEHMERLAFGPRAKKGVAE